MHVEYNIRMITEGKAVQCFQYPWHISYQKRTTEISKISSLQEKQSVKERKRPTRALEKPRARFALEATRRNDIYSTLHGGATRSNGKDREIDGQADRQYRRSLENIHSQISLSIKHASSKLILLHAISTLSFV